MRFFSLLTATILGGLILSPEGRAQNIAVHDLVPEYIAIQEALAADDLAGAQAKAHELQKKALPGKSKDLKKIKASLASFIKSRSIASARKEFKKLSPSFVDWADKNKDSRFEVLYCPMAGAKWLQRKGEVSNPYFGKEMLHCGEKTS